MNPKKITFLFKLTESIYELQKVSFIGLGVMGYPMAGYISKADIM